jgi:hypothetical protein
MAFINELRSQAVIELTDSIQEACDDYLHFIKYILEPAKKELEEKVRENEVLLHQAFGANLVLAHSVDYLKAIRSAAGITEDRIQLVRSFDEKFAVRGAYISNHKMELVDGINNALKHVRLEPDRYKSLGERYGQISFRCLVEHEGRVICPLANYRFDYCRVVLLPALKALSGWRFESAEDVLAFAKGECLAEDWNCSVTYDPSDPSTAIDRMIEICSSPCRNCEEEADECRCSEYVFDGKEGRFESLYSVSESDFNELMSQISPSWSRK